MEFEFGRLAVMVLALGAGAIVKGATGMGLPLVALPVLTTFFGLQHAVGLMCVPLIFTNAWQVWRFRAAANDDRMAFLPLFLVGGAVGIGLGTWALTSLPERALVLTLGIILLCYVALRLAAPHFVVGPVLARRAGPLAGMGGGVLQGATGISAPIGVTFIHAMSLDRDTHVFAVSTMFLLYALVQLPALSIAGVMQPQWLLEGFMALLPILLFMPLGQAIAGRLSRKAFDRMILIFLGLIGVKMVLGL
ncbi:sulfite exporter TauE/SafE family protein [Devosia sp. XJ19-1]|uniref:Probable membrane transporter protein n=1 Tax=Devosia ureilytica TaxID=2952754 RepID=A0A9Q4AN09_9HYPH|nr:sulfite exporter TauE/SafE family protein [Devosia ureilytica]MCP8882982.1 sulfite exporter TauE/SafE family protein [Devosia ureilytica]MCP8886650.1 sulfite exporter TauE/SafE family protein [Devosia ureilytica]